MIARISGVVVEKNKDSVVVHTSGGVGYEIKVTNSYLLQVHLHQEVNIHTYLKVSDSAMDVYGFQQREEKDFFELLMTVSGIGPKSAMNILSLGDMHKIRSAIGRGDVIFLTSVQGLGKKTAERLVVELKSKIMNSTDDVSSATDEQSITLSEVIDGLMALGYSKEESKQKVKDIDLTGKSTQQILKLALKK